MINKKCKICDNQFVALTEEKVFCSPECLITYVKSDEFDKEMEDYFNSSNKIDEKGNNI